jgi:hypothetical protein
MSIDEILLTRTAALADAVHKLGAASGMLIVAFTDYVERVEELRGSGVDVPKFGDVQLIRDFRAVIAETNKALKSATFPAPEGPKPKRPRLRSVKS